MKRKLYPALMEKVAGLARREQVLRGFWAGKGVKQIAGELGISQKTVEYHRAQLFRVFGVRDLVSLCRRALLMRVIRLKDGCESAGSQSPRKGSRKEGAHGA